jgi:DNA-directed RNA polymerase subunit N (RpoN/RPB10)
MATRPVQCHSPEGSSEDQYEGFRTGIESSKILTPGTLLLKLAVDQKCPRRRLCTKAPNHIPGSGQSNAEKPRTRSASTTPIIGNRASPFASNTNHKAQAPVTSMSHPNRTPFLRESQFHPTVLRLGQSRVNIQPIHLAANADPLDESKRQCTC